MPGEFVINPALGNQTIGAGSGMASSGQAPGTIMGMTPQMFAAIAGQLGAALSPEGSSAQKVGSLAANMGSQKIQQLAMAEKDKKQEELYKEILKRMTPEQLSTTMASGSFDHIPGESADVGKLSGSFNLGTPKFGG